MPNLVIDSSNYRKGILAALLVVLWLIPGVVLAWTSYSNPYALLDFSSVQQEMVAGRDIGIGSGAGYEALLSAVSMVCGIGMSSLLYLPIGSLLIPLIYYCASRKFSSARYAALTSIFVAYMTPLVTMQFSLLIFTSVSVIMLVFVLALAKYLRSRNFGLALAIILLIVASLFIHRGLAAWLVIALMVASIGGRSWRRRSVKVSPVLDIAAFSLLLFFVFEFHFYEDLLPAMASQGLTNPTGDLQYILGNFFWVRADFANDPLRHADPGGAALGICSMLTFFMLFIPLAYALTVSRKRLKSKKREIGFATEFLLLVSVFSIFIGDLVVNFIYYGRGFGMYPALLLFPVMLPLAFSIIRRVQIPAVRRETVYFALAILVVAMVSLAAFQVNSDRMDSDGRTGNFTAFWQENGSNDTTMTASFGSYGLLSLSLTESNVSPPMLFSMNSSNYRYLLGSVNATGWPAEFFLFTDSDFESPILGADWQYYQPIAEQRLLAIEANTNLTLAYDDGINSLLYRS
jgi:hypothetical protein